MTDRQELNGVIISDFNAENLAGCLRREEEGLALTVSTAGFGQVETVLLDGQAECWRGRPDFAVVWTRPEGVIASFREALEGREAATERALPEVDRFAELVCGAAERVRVVLAASWAGPADKTGTVMLDLRCGGAGRMLLEINLRLAERLEQAGNVYLLDAERWVRQGGKNACNPKLWYMGKVPFGAEVFAAAAADIKAALKGITGKAKKLILLDLDDTLWGGIVGEVGWEQVRLGGHDPEGEALADFQRALKALARRGVLLALVSKNEEATALEAIRKHPEMVLRAEDFAGWRINWQDKAANIADLLKELNLPAEAAVFIDDSAAERARVREALPGVLVPEWPREAMRYRRALLSLGCFETPRVSREDRERTALYATERQREELKRQVGSVEEWLRSLNIRVRVEELNEGNLARAAQLLNKTNQMNLRTRRLTEGELWEWAEQAHHWTGTFRVTDRLGDSGLTGILSLELTGTQARIVDFVLSCRVLGRKIEETMLHAAAVWARQAKATEVVAEYRATEKNKLCREFLQRSGWREEKGVYHWGTNQEYPLPECIQLDGDGTCGGGEWPVETCRKA